MLTEFDAMKQVLEHMYETDKEVRPLSYDTMPHL